MRIDLEKFDSWIFDFLMENAERMPKRLKKMIAYYYADARIRKLYWSFLGIEMGSNTYPGLGMMASYNGKKVAAIGENVSIGPRVMLISDSCANNGDEINRFGYVKGITKNEIIEIEDECWIGANVTILPGIRIGRCSVIGAGSVVTKDVEPYSVCAGVPARKMGDVRGEGNERTSDKENKE